MANGRPGRPRKTRNTAYTAKSRLSNKPRKLSGGRGGAPRAAGVPINSRFGNKEQKSSD
jgi:hypothetical protein